MKPGGAGLLEGDMDVDAGTGLAENATTVIPEGESDDEYEQIPARKEKQRRLEPPQEDHDQGIALALTNEGALSQDAPPADTPENGDAASQEVAPAATDEDWLRSRTNRLLDLVDADDLPAAATVNSERVPPSTGAEPSGEPVQAAAETSPHVAADDTASHAEAGHREDASAEDVIRRTARLFIRNLPYTATEDDLRAELEKFGTVQEVRGRLISFSLATHRDGMQRDEPQIGTAYTTVSDENPGRIF